MRLSFASELAVSLLLVCVGACSSDEEKSSSLVDGGSADDAASLTDASGALVDAANANDARVDASADDAGALAIPAAGTCTFSVDGTPYTSTAGDPFTVAVLKDGSLTVQCVAVVGDVRNTVNLAANGVTGPGTSGPGLGQLSEQPATGGSPTQYRNFATTIDVVALTATAVSGRANFLATGTMSKRVAAAFQLAR